ncbi:MAG: hypothetical protein WCW52_00020 [Elusimicrobiales bacterium]
MKYIQAPAVLNCRIRIDSSVLAAAAAGLLLCGFRNPGCCLTPAQETRLAVYETAVSGGDPAAALEFLADKRLAAALAAADPQKEASLKARAEALKDLQDLLDLPWDDATMNRLNQALAIRMDKDKPLSLVGVGPEPEKLLSWLKKYRPGYPEEKIGVLKKAIRQWEVVFGSAASVNVIWDQARGEDSVNAAASEWETWTLRERNAVMSRIVIKTPKLISYDAAALAAAETKKSLTASVAGIIKSGALSPEQQDRLNGPDLAEQLYLLGGMFDGGKTAVNPDLKAVVNAARNSMPKEVLPYRQRELLGAMLRTAVSKELAGTRAGGKVLAFYSGGAQPAIEVRPWDGGEYSRHDDGSGAVLLNCEVIEQYMRVKGYTAESLMKSGKQVREIAGYISPLVVYEAGHRMRDAWAKKAGVYDPAVQENEIEALSLEALYTGEKIKKDPEFGKSLKDLRAVSDYAAKRLETASEFRASGPKKFAATARQRYFSGLPSLAAAASQILAAVTVELSRRAAVTTAESGCLQDIGLAEAMEMTPEELFRSAGELSTAVLKKLRKDLSDLTVHKAGY